DTPEQRTNLKVRLRTLAATIADKDLAHAYKEELLDRYAALRARSGSSGDFGGFRDGGALFAPRSNRSWDRAKRGPPDPGLRPLAKVQIVGRIKPFHAAIALAAVDHPGWARSYDEAIERVGFGDPRLKPLALELFSALCDDHPDDVSLRESLDRRGLGQALAEVERIALPDAPFLDPRFDRAKARELWAACYQAVIEIADSERALDGMRHEAVTAATLAATRHLRDRIAVIERRISNLEFWRVAQ
ncbi:MAG: hypothetical protein ACOVN4_07855, partial [Bosea sp. (in: a-proteobacteria)]